jgi:hypothetical protein
VLSLNGDRIVEMPLGAMIGFALAGLTNGPIVHPGRWPAAVAGPAASTQVKIVSLISVVQETRIPHCSIGDSDPRSLLD